MLGFPLVNKFTQEISSVQFSQRHLQKYAPVTLTACAGASIAPVVES